MEARARDAAERRTGTQRLIREMLAERRQMWILYCKVAKLAPFEKDEMPARTLLEAFCQVLVDYIASSHFGLYERIAAGRERRRGVRDTAAEVYEQISASTDVAVAFNDSYDADQSFSLDAEFAAELSSLGEALATRIELEDRIIEAMVATT